MTNDTRFVLTFQVRLMRIIYWKQDSFRIYHHETSSLIAYYYKCSDPMRLNFSVSYFILCLDQMRFGFCFPFGIIGERQKIDCLTQLNQFLGHYP